MENIKNVFIPDGKNSKKKTGVNLENYSHIRAYHGCRPVDVGRYYVEGIKPFNIKEMRCAASKIFGISEETVIAKEPNLQPALSNNVYFVLFKQELLNSCGHYLCWGSEYLAAIAAQLDRSEYGKYHDILSDTGIPTIFICDIPIDFLPQWQIKSISKHPFDSNSACWIPEVLHPEHIVSHEHPSKIYNPVQMRQYINRQTTCKYCADIHK
ncbi:MAG: hypothetical protein A4E53_00429 [Pelotomaculum sp. PtaB.Bin104]|nr:MAG: hypothetical protein A4E53_00429 [Pelotomaculum sp. PtaB.Bin104]